MRGDNLRRHWLLRHRMVLPTEILKSIKSELREEKPQRIKTEEEEPDKMIKHYPSMKLFREQAEEDLPVNMTRMDQSQFILDKLAHEHAQEHLKLAELRPWQADFLKIVKEFKDDRKITFLCDEEGGAGKNALISHILVTQENTYEISASFHILQEIYNQLKNKSRTKDIFIFMNLSRNVTPRFTQKLPIEDLKQGYFKNGYGKSLKYDPNLIHLIITSNIPTGSLKNHFNLTSDRYHVFRLDKGVLEASDCEPKVTKVRKYKCNIDNKQRVYKPMTDKKSTEAGAD